MQRIGPFLRNMIGTSHKKNRKTESVDFFKIARTRDGLSL
ncbi:hypothetical protein LEP1GSC188_2528 [Leptospira weilii serovar Topaz str. LT2116]|uniref:Uncharacterized protein n=1 Tax=Leptospira weilii serovar Topaz str. LT2116 TaxID=1088540 RepID=M3EGJ2_9LEPT|nr:hypothetical protein LEP1GSC188_2528 [Leptospira weilii serovar Topaz str. LT2116]